MRQEKRWAGSCVAVLALSLTRSVSLGKSLTLSEPQLHCCKKGIGMKDSRGPSGLGGLTDSDCVISAQAAHSEGPCALWGLTPEEAEGSGPLGSSGTRCSPGRPGLLLGLCEHFPPAVPFHHPSGPEH